MALPPTDATNDAFVREVDEEFRRSQIVGIWTKYGKLIVGAVVVGLLVLGGVLYFNSLTERAAGTQGREFDEALRNVVEKHEDKGAPALRKLATTGNPGYRAMARFAEAELLFAKKDVKGAAARYAEIAGDADLPQPYRDRATVQQTMIEFDTMKPAAVIERLKTLAVPDSPWFGSAGEMVAAAYLKMGRRDAASRLYGQIAGAKGVPDSIRDRVSRLAGVVAIETTKQPEEKKAQ